MTGSHRWLSLFLVVVETLWLKTHNTYYHYHAGFWNKLLLPNFGIGVISGISLEFQFGTNWAGFAVASGDFMGNILGFVAAMAFMLEAGFIAMHDVQVAGLKEFARDDQPPVLVPFYGFRIMVAIGFWLLLLTVWTLWRWRRGRALQQERRLLRLWLASLPLGYIAVQTGWLLCEVGRQPWRVHSYALLGATYLAVKTRGELQERSSGDPGLRPG